MEVLSTVRSDSERVDSIAISGYLSLPLRTNERINEREDWPDSLLPRFALP